MKKILVTSDQHLGYANSDAESFSAFLDSLAERDDVDSLVLLGDFVDMWRRDVSGLFVELHDVLGKVLALQSTMKVYVVAGNHDYHLLQLKDHGYPVHALPDLVLDAGGGGTQVSGGDGATTTAPITRYRFVHGWEFDLAQHPLVMEALCHNFSDESGAIRSDVYAELGRIGAALDDILRWHGGPQEYVDNLMQPPEARLSPYLPDVERKAFSSQESSGEILVFGHTHRPFISSDGTVVNTGSWVTDAPVHNTYVELEGNQARLFVFKGQEITTRVPRPG